MKTQIFGFTHPRDTEHWATRSLMSLGETSPENGKGVWPYQHLDFTTSASMVLRQWTSIFINHLLCDTCKYGAGKIYE